MSTYPLGVVFCDACPKDSVASAAVPVRISDRNGEIIGVVKAPPGWQIITNTLARCPACAAVDRKAHHKNVRRALLSITSDRLEVEGGDDIAFDYREGCGPDCEGPVRDGLDCARSDS